MRVRRIIILCLLLILTLGIAPTLSQGNNLDEVNCALTPDQILGQAFGATAGAEGETADNALTPEGLNILDNNLDAGAAWIVENLQYAPTGSNQVALLVVDDFSSDPFDPDSDHIVSHGWLVWDVLQQIVAELPEDVTGNIHLEQVNIADDNGYRSDLIQATLDDAIQSLTSEGYERFVVNMSFVFIPCVDNGRGFTVEKFLQDRKNNPGLSVIEALGGDVEYIRGLLNNPRVDAIDETGIETVDTDRGNQPEFVQEQVNFIRFFEDQRLEGDPMRRFFRDLNGLVIPVASAGNFKWKRPFYPARWREVLSISASEGDDLGVWSHSNSGELMVPGAWFQFEDEVYRAGTSFAAPVASLMIALDLTQDSPNCGVRGGAPLLGQAQFDNTPLLEAAEGC